MTTSQHRVTGVLAALVGIALFCLILVPLRHHLSPATAALALVVPVVVGVAIGGFGAGVVSVVAGFLAYDFFFVPPYGRFTVATAQDWVALFVYAVVMLVVARVFSFLQEAQTTAERREADTRRFSELSDLLIADNSLEDVLALLVTTVHQTFEPRWVAVLMPSSDLPDSLVETMTFEGTGQAADPLGVAASVGVPITEKERRQLQGTRGHLSAAGGTAGGNDDIVVVALTASGRPVGLLALSAPSTPDATLSASDVDLLRTYANQAALAIERSAMREVSIRSETLEAVDRWRAAMMGAVSHDLRTPLASVKAAVSTLRQHDAPLSAHDQEELLELIESQSDSLDRLVANLLDMTRLEAGALTLHRQPESVSDLVEDAVAALGTVLDESRLVSSYAADLPMVDVDRILMTQVLANLIQNAERYSPDGQLIEVTATRTGDVVTVVVRDHGPGVDPGDQERIFRMFNRVSGGGRAGLGLTIAQAFTEAHGQHISVENDPEGGARFLVTMPVAATLIEVG